MLVLGLDFARFGEGLIRGKRLQFGRFGIRVGSFRAEVDQRKLNRVCSVPAACAARVAFASLCKSEKRRSEKIDERFDRFIRDSLK